MNISVALTIAAVVLFILAIFMPLAWLIPAGLAAFAAAHLPI